MAQTFARYIRKIKTRGTTIHVKQIAWNVFPSNNLEKQKENLFHIIKKRIKEFESIKGNTFYFNSSNLSSMTSMTIDNIAIIQENQQRIHNELSVLHKIPRNNDIKVKLHRISIALQSANYVLGRSPDNYDSFFSSFIHSKTRLRRPRLRRNDAILFKQNSRFGELLILFAVKGNKLPTHLSTHTIAWLGNDVNLSQQKFKLHADGFAVEEGSEDGGKHAYVYVKIGELSIPEVWASKTREDIVALISPYDDVKEIVCY